MVKGVLTLFLFLTISIPLSAQQYILQGVVTDSLTKEPLPYASVRLKDTTEGTTTGSDGRFYFKTSRSEAVLVVSVIGYNDYSRQIRPARNASYKIALSPTSYSLNEVVVKPKREHYRKKDNPAVEFVRHMIGMHNLRIRLFRLHIPQSAIRLLTKTDFRVISAQKISAL